MNYHFVWDSAMAASNQRKHGISFDEARTVFSDPLARIFDDEDHSNTEHREIIIGHSAPASPDRKFHRTSERHSHYQRPTDNEPGAQRL